MKIHYHGHACFSITTADGGQLLMDPFDPSVGYEVKTHQAAVITCSHSHHDHNYTACALGNPTIITDVAPVELAGFNIRGVKTFHDDENGKKRGENIIFCVKADGLTIVHCGDLGHMLTHDQAKEIGPVHVLLVPVGGYYTIDAATAADVADMLSPLVTIPMHYRTSMNPDMPIERVEGFLELMKQREYAISHRMDTVLPLDPDDLPRSPRVIQLDYRD
ncbi:MBL fold metallo-hydrolase [Eubacteriales bacterium OttesenSCG-928-M02]|nr:MBL fold metallo-hydrolase [Eubacteriales bacterium OttesenSCG-928-M02]